MSHPLPTKRRQTASTEVNREQPIYGGSLLWDPASGDLRSVPRRSFSHVPVLGCTRAWQNGRSPADLPIISTKCRAASLARPGQSLGSGRRSLHRRMGGAPSHRAWGDPPEGV
jgi:hypothetical protein